MPRLSTLTDPPPAWGTGGILHLPDAMKLHEKRHGNRNVVLFCRVSTPAQLSQGRLDTQINSEFRFHEEASCNVVAISAEQHSGRLDHLDHLDHLYRTFGIARDERAFVGTRDLNRYIRTDDFEHGDSVCWHRQATPDDRAVICRLAEGVIVSTRISPDLSARRTHIEVTKSGRKPGRRRKLDHETAHAILVALGRSLDFFTGKVRWATPLSVVAWQFREKQVNKALVQRLVESLVPEQVRGRTGLQWRDLTYPADVYFQAWKAGILSEEE